MMRIGKAAAMAFALAIPAHAAPASAQQRVLIENVGPDGRSIMVDHGTIVESAGGESLPAAELRVDAGGLHALPGLIDMHVHVWGEAELNAYLAYGVTTVRNMSGMPFHLQMAERIEAGTLQGPRLFTAGPILNSPGPNAQINHLIVVSEAEGREAVRAQAEAGYTRIKTYSNLHEDAWRGILAEAQERGLSITGHTPEGERLEGIPHDRPFALSFADILGAGWETIEHAESIYFHALRDRWDELAARNTASALAASGNPVTPTLIAHRNLVRMAQTQGGLAERDGIEWMNPVLQQLEQEVISFWAAQDPAFERGRAAHYADFTRMMHEEGVLLVAGSDAGIFANVPGLSLVEELELLVQAGLTPRQVLEAATVNAARALGEEGRLGCLDAGCAADLVFYACDPLADIGCLRSPAAMMRGGRWYDAAGLAALRAAAADHDMEQIVQDIAAGMAAQGTPLDPAMLGM